MALLNGAGGAATSRRRFPTDNRRLRRDPSHCTTLPNTNTTRMAEAEAEGSGRSCRIIKVIVLGGGGSNAVDRMLETRIDGLEF